MDAFSSQSVNVIETVNAEQFNLYFSNIGKDLATEISPADVEPECYLKPSTQTFSLRIPTVGEVRVSTKRRPKT